MKKKSNSCRGFTLIDLLAVVLMLVFAASLLAPAMARTRPAGQTARCLSNHRRLMGAWQMYSADNSGKLVVNTYGGSAQGGAGDPTYGMSWAEGWLDWTLAKDNTNLAFIVTSRYARLAAYLSSDAANVFQCPADNYVSSVQRASGWTRRCRSASLSLNVGAGNAAVGPFDAIYRQVLKDSDFQSPTPAETFTFLDEHPDSINDPGFFSPYQAGWVDLPATYHNGACAFGFADGHAEIHKWSASLTRLRTVQFNFTVPTPSPGDRDIHWLSYHSARLSATSY